MALSKNWETAKDIYRDTPTVQTEKITIYRASTGFEAYIIGETETAWIIEGNGVKCAIKKSTTKNNLFKVSANYELKKYIHKPSK